MRWPLLVLLACSCTSNAQRITRATSAIYVRSDTDRTTVVTPSVAVSGQVARGTTIDASYEADAWTGASVDVVTAATPAIHEIRNEVGIGIGLDAGALHVGAHYRYSFEPDYRSHGVVLGGKLELARKNTTIGVDLLASADTVGRAGDPLFEQPLRGVGGRISLAQVLDKRTLIEVIAETIRVHGFQASPYRWVAIGGDGVCASTAPLCVPEHVPEDRQRSDAFVRLRRALARTWSAGLEYRFYFDDWGLRSHAVQPDIAWRPVEHGMLSLRYRYYTQNDATFYRPRYFDLAGSDGYATRDRKLSALFSHEVGVAYLHRFELCDGDRVILAGARTTLSRIEYLAFVGLDHVWALEATALVGLELP